MNGSRLQFGEAEARNADTLIALGWRKTWLR